MTTPVFNTILEAIGQTPMVRIRKHFPECPEATILCKVEYLNPNGSMKDRIGCRMLEMAEAEGRIKPGDTLVEPTSGNTGLGLALAAAVKGYKLILTMPEKVSAEKQNFAKALGAQIITAPTELPHDHPDNYIGIARKLAEQPNHHLLNQYEHPGNPDAHYTGTGREIWEQTQGKIDYFVSGMGTGDTISGSARFLKEQNPAIQVVGIDPEGSIFTGDTPRTYHVEGIGYDFWPNNLNRDIIDRMYRVSDATSFREAALLARQEGILGGGSTGTSLGGIRQLLKDVDCTGKTIVFIAHDSGRNYLSKQYNPQWLIDHGFEAV